MLLIHDSIKCSGRKKNTVSQSNPTQPCKITHTSLENWSMCASADKTILIQEDPALLELSPSTPHTSGLHYHATPNHILYMTNTCHHLIPLTLLSPHKFTPLLPILFLTCIFLLLLACLHGFVHFLLLSVLLQFIINLLTRGRVEAEII